MKTVNTRIMSGMFIVPQPIRHVIEPQEEKTTQTPKLIAIMACGLFILHLIGFLSEQNKRSRNNSSVHGFHHFAVITGEERKVLRQPHTESATSPI